jgi:hypothetical protein
MSPDEGFVHESFQEANEQFNWLNSNKTQHTTPLRLCLAALLFSSSITHSTHLNDS